LIHKGHPKRTRERGWNAKTRFPSPNTLDDPTRVVTNN